MAEVGCTLAGGQIIIHRVSQGLKYKYKLHFLQTWKKANTLSAFSAIFSLFWIFCRHPPWCWTQHCQVRRQHGHAAHQSRLRGKSWWTKKDWEVNHNEQKDWEVAQYWAKSNEQPTSAGASWRGGIVQQWGTATISLHLSVLHLAASYWCGKSLLKRFFYYELFILPGNFFCCHNWLENEKKSITGISGVGLENCLAVAAGTKRGLEGDLQHPPAGRSLKFPQTKD